MVIKELEDSLQFMISVGFTEQRSAQLLSDYFHLRYLGAHPEKASETIFTEIDSKINREIYLKEKIAAFHKRLCRLEGFAPEEVSEAVEAFYKAE